MQSLELDPPNVDVAQPVDGAVAPVTVIRSEALRALGQSLTKTFDTYKSDRVLTEQKWLRNLRQYLGIYDPDIEKEIPKGASKAYPKLTRVKCISVLSRVINLMFPGNDRNWTMEASPSPDMDPADVQAAVAKIQEEDAAAGMQTPMDEELVERAVNKLACERADELRELIDDQLQEIGGDQSLDYVHLNRKVVASGILYGLGVMRGPFVREETQVRWGIDPVTQKPAPQSKKVFKPMLEHISVWDFYPDMSAKSLQAMDGYFLRYVMTRSQVLALAKRDDFFGPVIKNYLKEKTQGNYKPQTFETELRGMGTKANVNDQKVDAQKYELITWFGPISAATLKECGVDIPAGMESDEIDAEVWMIDGYVIKADLNPWVKLGASVRTIHTFLFDEDDTSPVGNGLPNVMRDSAMGVAAATRMLMDNASVTCGPNLEVNRERMVDGQDITSIQARKIWYSEGTGPDTQYPAVKNIQIDSHMPELLQIIELWMKFADVETFVGAATGGDMEKGPSEPMRTAAGASMLRGDAALPFKDIIRNFDTFTMSIISALIFFNRKFNPTKAAAGDYNVIARGATSLIAKEVRGIQLDTLAQTLSDDDKMDLDNRRFLEERLKVRDCESLLVSEDEGKRRRAANAQQQQQMQDAQMQLNEANVRKLLSDAFKNIAQGQKNTAAADAATINAGLAVLEHGMQPEPKDVTPKSSSAK